MTAEMAHYITELIESDEQQRARGYADWCKEVQELRRQLAEKKERGDHEITRQIQTADAGR